jgi:hypothetical protein
VGKRSNTSEDVKKLESSVVFPKGWMDLRNFRMRSLRLKVTCHGNRDTCLSGLTIHCFNFQRLRSKVSPIHPTFRLNGWARFFTPFHSPHELAEIQQGCRRKSYSGNLILSLNCKNGWAMWHYHVSSRVPTPISKKSA